MGRVAGRLRLAEPIAKPTSKVGFAIFILIRVANRMGPERAATMSLHLVQILFAQAKVAQNSCQSSLRDVLASVAWDRGKRAILRIPPDFMRPWSLSNKLTTQLVKLFDQYAISHTGTRRSA